MARLPAYVPNLQLSTGGQAFREISPNNAVGRALEGLGDAVGNIGAKVRQQQAAEAEKNEAREYIASTRLAIDFEAEAQKLYLEHEKNLGPDPSGFYGNYSAQLEERFQQLWTDNAYDKSPNSDRIRLQFDRVKREWASKALNTEASLFVKYKADTHSSYLKSLQTSAALSSQNAISAGLEWDNFVETSNPTMSPEVKAAYKSEGRKLIAASALESVARSPRWTEFQQAMQPVKDGIPAEGLPTHIQSAINGANEVGYSPDTVLAIAYIESAGFNDKYVKGDAVPRRRDGTPMSSAQGMFQVLSARDTLDAIGITKDEKWDYQKVARGLGRHIQEERGKLEALGVKVTPGMEYMIWNMGPAMTRAVATAPPGTRIRDLAVRVLARRGPAFVAQWLNNNPGMYRPDSTVETVLANYDRKIAKASENVQKMFPGVGGPTEDVAREIGTKLLGPEVGQHVTLAALGDIYARVSKDKLVEAKENSDVTLGTRIAHGAVEPIPGDPDHKRALNKIAERYGFDPSGILEGKGDSYIQLGQIVKTFGNIPEGHEAALKATLESSNKDAKVSAYEFLAQLRQDDLPTFNASGLKGADADIKKYVGLTQVLGYKPMDAVKMIDFEKSEQGKAAEAARTAGDKGKAFAAELSRRTADELASHLDSWLPFDEPGFSSATQKEMIGAAYKHAYRYYRDSVPNSTEQSAKAMALAEIKSMFQRTSVFSQNMGGTLTLAAPEMFFKSRRVPPEQHAAEIERQAVMVAKTRLAEIGYDYLKDDSLRAGPDAHFRRNLSLVATGDTLRAIRSGKSPKYQLWYRGGPNGMMLLDGEFSPSALFADAEALGEFMRSSRESK